MASVRTTDKAKTTDKDDSSLAKQYKGMADLALMSLREIPKTAGSYDLDKLSEKLSALMNSVAQEAIESNVQEKSNQKIPLPTYYATRAMTAFLQEYIPLIEKHAQAFATCMKFEQDLLNSNATLYAKFASIVYPGGITYEVANQQLEDAYKALAAKSKALEQVANTELLGHPDYNLLVASVLFGLIGATLITIGILALLANPPAFVIAIATGTLGSLKNVAIFHLIMGYVALSFSAFATYTSLSRTGSSAKAMDLVKSVTLEMNSMEKRRVGLWDQSAPDRKKWELTNNPSNPARKK